MTGLYIPNLMSFKSRFFRMSRKYQVWKLGI
jgi:hypothetical protein